MKPIIFILGVLLAISVIAIIVPKKSEQKIPTTMRIQSLAFTHNQQIPSKYTCDGENINPPLTFSDIPEGAKSLALINDDPDAPVGTWIHWTVWNIPPQTKEVKENGKPEGVEGTTSFGKPGYGGPCPPSGTHRYFFKLYALDTILELNTSATKQDLEEAMAGHILAQGELIGLYARK